MDANKFKLYIVLIISTAIMKNISAFDSDLKGQTEGCQNEGEPVHIKSIDTHNCYSCMCKNGYVQCTSECPKYEQCHMLITDNGCCHNICKGCLYKNIYHQSHTEWTDPINPCKMLRCEAGVLTESELRCNTPCSHPLPPEPGKCCPTCPECIVNGQTVSEDRDVVPDDPCLKCRCSKGQMTCAKKACPVLQCSISQQHHPPEECCPVCIGFRELLTIPNHCTLQSSMVENGKYFDYVDRCTSCQCLNDTTVCKRTTCPILECTVDQQEPVPGSCCKKCALPEIEEFKSECHSSGRTYEDGQSWMLSSCSSCKCQRGKASCAVTKCNVTSPCPQGTRLVKNPGECCSKCEEMEGVCMVFGDPHYKTFDGKIYNFKGAGKYQLAADCVNNTFSIRVANVNKASSTSTKRVGVKFGDIRLNLQQKGRVKFNGERVRVPFKRDGKVRIEKLRDGIEVTLQNGVKLFWNSKSFLEVAVPVALKNKLCGLCGNFNSNALDDLKTKSGRIVRDTEILSFGLSWCVGNKSECEKKIKSNSRSNNGKHRAGNSQCKFLNDTNIFDKCISKLNYNKYYSACKMDMINCHSGKCYCESLMAYARECERLGVHLRNWQKHTSCDASKLKKKTERYEKNLRGRSQQNLLQYSPFMRNATNPLRNPIPIQ